MKEFVGARKLSYALIPFQEFHSVRQWSSSCITAIDWHVYVCLFQHQLISAIPADRRFDICNAQDLNDLIKLLSFQLAIAADDVLRHHNTAHATLPFTAKLPIAQTHNQDT